MPLADNFIPLTFNPQDNKNAPGWLGWDLTLVGSLVLGLNLPDEESKFSLILPEKQKSKFLLICCWGNDLRKHQQLPSIVLIIQVKHFVTLE